MGLGVEESNIIHSGEATNELRLCQHIDDIFALACGLVVSHAINKHFVNAFYIQGHSTSRDSGSLVSFLFAAAVPVFLSPIFLGFCYPAAGLASYAISCLLPALTSNGHCEVLDRLS